MIDSDLAKGINDELRTLIDEVTRLRFLFNHANDKRSLEPTIDELEIERKRFNGIVYSIRVLHRSL